MTNHALKYLYDNELESILYRIDEAKRGGHFEGHTIEADEAALAHDDTIAELRRRRVGVDHPKTEQPE